MARRDEPYELDDDRRRRSMRCLALAALLVAGCGPTAGQQRAEAPADPVEEKFQAELPLRHRLSDLRHKVIMLTYALSGRIGELPQPEEYLQALSAEDADTERLLKLQHAHRLYLHDPRYAKLHAELQAVLTEHNAICQKHPEMGVKPLTDDILENLKHPPGPVNIRGIGGVP